MCKLDSAGSPLGSIRGGEYRGLFERQPYTECLLRGVRRHSRVFSPSLLFIILFMCVLLFQSEVFSLYMQFFAPPAYGLGNFKRNLILDFPSKYF
jgi:hypothetical protein